MRLPLLCALNYAVLAGGVTTTASDLSRPLGDPQLERPTLRSLGVYWIIQGDENQNAFIGLGTQGGLVAQANGCSSPPPRRGRHVVPGSGGGTGTVAISSGAWRPPRAAAPGEDLFRSGKPSSTRRNPDDQP